MSRQSRRPLPRQLVRQLPRPVRGQPVRPRRGRTARTALGVMSALAAVLGLALVTEPDQVVDAGEPGTRVAVHSTVATCPHPESAGSLASYTRVSIAVPPAADVVDPATAADQATGTDEAAAESEQSEDRASVAVPGAKKPVLQLDALGTATFKNLPASKPDVLPLIAKASGTLAPGFSASQTTLTLGDGASRSLAGTSCPEPGTEFWFAGAGASVNHTSWLYLVNPENAQASVDIELYDEKGTVEASGLDARVLHPGEKLELFLGGDIGEHDQLVVRVVARVGRVVAAVHDQQQKGTREPLGADWIPGVREAATQVVVPAVPGGEGERTLHLFVPGDEGALARLRLVGKNGTFSPAPDPDREALDTIALEAGRVRTFDLRAVAKEEPFGVLIDSDKPVIAVMRVGTGDKPPETAFIAATPPLGGPSMVADGRTEKGMTSRLILTAPQATANASVTILVKGKEPTLFKDVKVPAGTTTEVSLSKVKGAYAILITPQPGSGPIYASRLLLMRRDDGDLMTIEQFRPTNTTALVPDVVNDLSAGLRPSG